jgi:short subunit dehydrogenase-like uncharacterized protein
MKSNLLIYGVSGRAGGLISRQAAEAGLPHLAAGRDLAAVLARADRLLLPHRVFSLEHLDKVERALGDVAVVLNAAGPFGETAPRLAEACLRTRTHYLDLAAEAGEIEAVRHLDRRAREAGVMLMPAVGVAVVPSDALVARLKRRLPGATRLRVASEATGGSPRARRLALLRKLGRPGRRRIDGELVAARPAEERLGLDLGGGPRVAVTDPWRGDLETAYWSNVIPDIDTYAVHPGWIRWALRTGILPSLAAWRGSRALLDRLWRQLPGPEEAVPAEGRTRLWVQVEDDTGRRMTARLRGPEETLFAAHTALWIARRVLAGSAPVGFQTPATAYGPDLIDRLEREVPGIEVAWSADG